MENRFLETDEPRQRHSGRRCGPRNGHAAGADRDRDGGGGTATLAASRSLGWSGTLSAQDRALVILVNNGGVDLGIPDLVDSLLSALPGSSLIPDSYRQRLVDFLRDKIKSFTDNLLETAELVGNRYAAAKPDLFGDVVILCDGAATYADLKGKLIDLSRAGRLIDLYILTHGGEDTIVAKGDINGQKIRDMKAEYGKPLSIRSVYMMNCVGSSLNQAWIDAGARVCSGSLRNNYLPEPTMFFFWNNWKDGQNFESAVTSAYRKTINLMNAAVRSFVGALPLPGSASLAAAIDFENMGFVKDSAPVIQGQRSLTINSDDLNFSQSTPSSLVTTVLSLSLVRSLADDQPGAPGMSLSPAGIEFIKSWEGFRAQKYNDPAGHCTIGYGTLLHTGNCDGSAPEQPYDNGITEDEATRLLAKKAEGFAKVVSTNPKVTLNQNQFDALVSFAYNIGEGAFLGSTLFKTYLAKGDLSGVPAEMKKWTKARKDGQLVDLPGLVKRRAAEAELFLRPVVPASQGQSLAGQGRLSVSNSFLYHSPSRFSSPQSVYSYGQSPFLILGLEVKDALAIGLGAISVVQAQVSASQGTFTLTYDKVQRLLTSEARAQMPGSQSSKSTFRRQLFDIGIGRLNAANANVTITWEGNPYGEIGTPVIERDLSTSTEWSKSSANITISKRDPIPDTSTDPRGWPIIFTYVGTYDPVGNGYFEFSGEFEINAFGGLKFNRHQVVSRSLADWANADPPERCVQKGNDIVVPVPDVPQEQINYLRSKLP
jgi:GH24 family phage-related lysozyme (muramidase)